MFANNLATWIHLAGSMNVCAKCNRDPTNNCWGIWGWKKSQGIIYSVIRVHPLGAMNVCMKFHGSHQVAVEQKHA